jgi:hypothetical protein
MRVLSLRPGSIRPAIVAPLLLALALLAPMLAGCGGGKAPEPAKPRAAGTSLAGRWVSQGCEPQAAMGQQTRFFIVREVNATDTDWSLTDSVYEDPACRTPLFSIFLEGPYDIGRASQSVPGANEATLAFKRKLIVAHHPKMVETFNRYRCANMDWQVGKSGDISATGCMNTQPITAACPHEFELVRIEKDRLYLGQRTSDMCHEQGRPKALNPQPLLKR